MAQRHQNQNQQQDEPRRLSSSGKASKGGKKETPPSMMMAVGVADQIQYPYDPWLPEEGDAAQRLTIPSISQPFYDNVIDVRATVSAKDTSLILSTAGNWQFALRKLLADKVFVENPEIQESYLITTTPPISVPQLNKGLVKVGNILFTDAQPHNVIGPPPLMNGLANMGFIPEDFTPVPICFNYGNVILKLVGTTFIETFADLATIAPGRFASATVGAVTNYRNTIRNIAAMNPDLPPSDMTPEELEAHLFDTNGVASIGPPMHQSISHMLITGQADAGLMFLELAVMIMEQNPGVFEAIYLDQDRPMGTSTTDPMELSMGQTPLMGNARALQLATITTVELTEEQMEARDAMMEALQSEELTSILEEVGMLRPPN